MKHFPWLRRKKSAEAQSDQRNAARSLVALDREDWRHMGRAIVSQATQIFPQNDSLDTVHDLQEVDNVRQSRTWSVPTAGPHEPLSSSQSGIRLLTIIYADANEVICELTNYSDLDLCPAFIALSYTWGSPQSTMRNITLNGRTSIRENLYAFLQHHNRAKDIWAAQPRSAAERRNLIYDPSNWQHFWIDALCINQSSNAEKSHQVNLMSRIFSQASFVLVWLPSPNFLSSSHIAQAAQTQCSSSSEGQDNLQLLVSSALDNPYWTRLWVVQEFLLAREILLCIDTTMITLRDFRQAESLQRGVVNKNQKQFDLLMGYQYYRDHDRVSRDILQLVSAFSKHECEDKRDRVFGLAGMADNIEADYSLSCEMLYVSMIRRMRRSHLSLNLLFPSDPESIPADPRLDRPGHERLWCSQALRSPYGLALATALELDDFTVVSLADRYFRCKCDKPNAWDLMIARQFEERNGGPYIAWSI
jgi:hypothetical protein